MPSSYSSLLRTEMVAIGEQADTWGTTNNKNIGTLLEAAVAGIAGVAMSDADYTLTALNGVSDEARSMGLSITGTLTAARNVICPASTKMFVVKNGTTGGFAITLKTLAGTGISVPNGAWATLVCDGTNVVSVTLATILTSAQLAAAISDETGSGALVFGTSPTIGTATLNSPTMVTPALGTPASGVLTNCTGVPVATGVSGLGAGVATFLATPSSANLAAAVSDETGTGVLVLATSPTLVTPVLGTPSSGTLTNCSGLPAAGVSGTALVAADIGASVQAYDADLAAIAALATGGLVARTGAGTAATRTLTAGTGCTVADGDGVAGNPTVSLIPGIGLGDVLSSGAVTAGTIVVHSGTTGQVVTQSTLTGVLKATSGVPAAASAGTDYVAPGGALGTPTSGTLTNCTGLPAGGLSATATDKLFGRSTVGAGVGEEISCTAFARTILDDADEATFKATVNLEIGTDVQAYDADLTTWAGVTPGTGVATFLATPTLANFNAALSDADVATGGGTATGTNTGDNATNTQYSGLDAAKVSKTSDTGSAVTPAGTTAQRDGSPSAGYFRYNSTLTSFEGYNGSAWGSVGGGATGGSTDHVFYENDQTVTVDYTITSGKNAGTFGPILINTGVVVTIPTGSVWSIV